MISTWVVVFAGACIGVIANTRLVARLEDKIPLGGPRGAVVLLLLIPALVIATSLLLGGVLAALEVRRRGSRCWRVSRGAGVSGPPRVTSSPPGRRRASRRARAAQGWSFRVGFEYLISAMCGLGNPLTEVSPDSTEGRMLAVLFASWQRAIGGTIIGLTGGIPILKVVPR